MSWRFRKRIRPQEPGEPWRWSEPEPPDNWKKDLFFTVLIFFGILAAAQAYVWLVTPANNFRFDPDFWLCWLVLLFPSFWFAGAVYLTIRALWSWLRNRWPNSKQDRQPSWPTKDKTR
jgi:uncharacterized BrkB/YihY/UPF0761 family membrane protein